MATRVLKPYDYWITFIAFYLNDSLTSLNVLCILPLFCCLVAVELLNYTNPIDDEKRCKVEFENNRLSKLFFNSITNYITVSLKTMHLYRIRPNNVFLVKRCCFTRDEPLQSKFYPCSHFHGIKKFARMHY